MRAVSLNGKRAGGFAGRSPAITRKVNRPGAGLRAGCCFLSLAGHVARAVIDSGNQHETDDGEPRDHEGNCEHGVVLSGLRPCSVELRPLRTASPNGSRANGTAAQVTRRRKTSPASVLNDRGLPAGWGHAHDGKFSPCRTRAAGWLLRDPIGRCVSRSRIKNRRSLRKSQMGKNVVQSRKPLAHKKPTSGRKWACVARRCSPGYEVPLPCRWPMERRQKPCP